MSKRIEKASNILRWAIENKKTITEACKVFKANKGYIRSLRTTKNKKLFSKISAYKEFELLHSRLSAGKEGKPYVEIVADDDLLDKDKTIDSPYLKFVQEQKSKGVLDARGTSKVRTLEDITREAKIDLDVWKIDRHVINKWDVTNREGQTFQNWQVKVWLSKIRTEEESKAWENFLKVINDASPNYPKIKRRKTGKNYLFELSLADLHVGKMGWGLESGDDYDTKIALGRYNQAIEDLISQVVHLADEIEEILLPIGNDLINVDNLNNMTTNGTPQTVDSRWQQMFLKTKAVMITNIDKLSEIAPVKVIMVTGNHDQQTVFYLGEALKAWYRNSDSVTIDNSPTQRKYYLYGANMIGYTHGNEEKHIDLGLIMATERPEMWAASKFREIHLGHFHKSKETKWIDSDEHQGFKIKILPSLSSSDSWHAKKGYIAVRSAKGLLYHKADGQVGEFVFNVK